MAKKKVGVVEDAEESKLLKQKESAQALMVQIQGFKVVNQQDFANAGELLKDIKSRSNLITDYWKGVKSTAYDTWKDLCAKEKELITPYLEAEATIKERMNAFQRQVLKEKREQEQEIEDFKKAEAKRLRDLAAEAEEEGRAENAQYLDEMAEEVETAPVPEIKKQKVQDIVTKTTWKAMVTDESLVPVEILGITIRPVDLKALDKLAKIGKKKLHIPGVKFYEDVSVSAKTR